ncbi:SDR family NAD(P)-dependent oxidoreductase [Burkholderia gladioli pv. gladioli]|uniref:NAD(P)-dependent oxidoreductase n=1 Tax=Burkholderia gladioli TaxID=28095 RepID=A0A095F2X5_BURGA|nr:SDR family NAD(P)-dependent oxidoreductase [Burkholderia gladioli]AJX01022.1 short chain dehydrogenase family protein [Burkholderia gladioli]ASD80018.1 NAD(P)-dependent oxidoreductase [Burkholderia gladioli pv. gladioli]AWY54736.1 NAD(P)-dependent oxidoreductase [Burkholderia gladioli pv. gladioli]KGC11693.1 short chain dehydrogenase family protein [Burkholderia gladioli]MDJ1160296.1 SDR family NAD(P)-dependent oxidoreductase [Burkholderia gladioli pv. gladioli]
MVPITPAFRLDGKTALVTGAGRGIGFAAAAALAQAGARVTLVARTATEIEAASEAINAAGGVSEFLALDVTDSARVSAVIEARGPFDVLVNSAGMNRPMELVSVPDEDIDAILALNVKAAFYVSRAVVKGLLKAGKQGSLINVSSQMGHAGSPGRTVYCASKHAMEGMTKALAWELGSKGIRVNTVCPTFIETSLTENMFQKPGFRSWVTSKIALGRVGRIEETMGAIVFLACDASSLVTGSALMLDGGWTAA